MGMRTDVRCHTLEKVRRGRRPGTFASSLTEVLARKLDRACSRPADSGRSINSSLRGANTAPTASAPRPCATTSPPGLSPGSLDLVTPRDATPSGEGLRYRSGGGISPPEQRAEFGDRPLNEAYGSIPQSAFFDVFGHCSCHPLRGVWSGSYATCIAVRKALRAPDAYTRPFATRR